MTGRQLTTRVGLLLATQRSLCWSLENIIHDLKLTITPEELDTKLAKYSQIMNTTKNRYRTITRLTFRDNDDILYKSTWRSLP